MKATTTPNDKSVRDVLEGHTREKTLINRIKRKKREGRFTGIVRVTPISLKEE